MRAQRFFAVSGVASSPFPIWKHVRQIAPPIPDEAKAHDIIARLRNVILLRNRQRWHHVAPRALQVLLDQIQGAPELGKPRGFMDLGA